MKTQYANKLAPQWAVDALAQFFKAKVVDYHGHLTTGLIDERD